MAPARAGAWVAVPLEAVAELTWTTFCACLWVHKVGVFLVGVAGLVADMGTNRVATAMEGMGVVIRFTLVRRFSPIGMDTLGFYWFLG
ncbi:hypothetical protein BC830DRAFT_1123892 [Chytriomyces sp. MP71]|nr:hypothetical protein BC830DRAFT_1132768 [Chytriomyces sp. MP71]KAI8615164.1 hypothetical protein BC830DRAFT_1123892 [Chytriomyces sp. MP71]